MKLLVETKGTICYSNECPHERDCANHRTAGDFRSEGGPTPRLMILNENQGECYGLYENHTGFLTHKDGEYYVSSYYDEHVQLRSHGVVKNPKWRQDNPRQQLAVVTQSLFGHLRNFVEGRIDADMLKDRLQGNNEMEEISTLIKMMPDGEWYE